MRAEESLQAKKTLIEGELVRILRRGNSLLDQAMRYAVFPGGKRFRPLLLLASGACFGVPSKVLVPFACALELIHNYSLIHDDLPAMDNDDFRRGKPSCHKAFGEDIALLAGDGLLTLAFQVAADAPVPARLLLQKHEAIGAISRRAGLRGMIGGQFLDVTPQPEKMTREALDAAVLKKTAALIIAAVEVGALLGRARSRERKVMADYGKNIGLAFQVRDDILDSGRERNPKELRRPDFVAFLGLEQAKRRLETLVRKAVAGLEKASLRPGELRYLAHSLLNLKPEVSRG